MHRLLRYKVTGSASRRLWFKSGTRLITTPNNCYSTLKVLRPVIKNTFYSNISLSCSLTDTVNAGLHLPYHNGHYLCISIVCKKYNDTDFFKYSELNIGAIVTIKMPNVTLMLLVAHLGNTK